MNSLIDLQEDGESNANLFVRRLSFWLVTASVVLMVLAVMGQITDIGSVERLESKNTDLEIVARMEWGTVFLVAAVWIFFISTFRSLGKQKEWARKATIGIFSILTVSFVWNGVLTLLMSVATLQMQPATMHSLGWSGRVLLILMGSMLQILAWLCWKVIRNLRTQVVRNVFQRKR